MTRIGKTALIGVPILLLLPLAVRFAFPEAEKYYLHLLIQILIWSFIYTGWSLMGRFGLTSFGHGAFTGIGAYVTVLLWNYAGLTPWIGTPIGIGFAVLLALVVGYPCFRLKVVGHYFALVTLALSQVVMLSIVAARDVTGGSLGFTPRAVGHSWFALQFPEKIYFYAISLVLWFGGLAVWYWIDRGIGRVAKQFRQIAPGSFKRDVSGADFFEVVVRHPGIKCSMTKSNWNIGLCPVRAAEMFSAASRDQAGFKPAWRTDYKSMFHSRLCSSGLHYFSATHSSSARRIIAFSAAIFARSASLRKRKVVTSAVVSTTESSSFGLAFFMSMLLMFTRRLRRPTSSKKPTRL